MGFQIDPALVQMNEPVITNPGNLRDVKGQLPSPNTKQPGGTQQAPSEQGQGSPAGSEPGQSSSQKGEPGQGGSQGQQGSQGQPGAEPGAEAGASPSEVQPGAQPPQSSGQSAQGGSPGGDPGAEGEGQGPGTPGGSQDLPGQAGTPPTPRSSTERTPVKGKEKEHGTGGGEPAPGGEGTEAGKSGTPNADLPSEGKGAGVPSKGGAEQPTEGEPEQGVGDSQPGDPDDGGHGASPQAKGGTKQSGEGDPVPDSFDEEDLGDLEGGGTRDDPNAAPAETPEEETARHVQNSEKAREERKGEKANDRIRRILGEKNAQEDERTHKTHNPGQKESDDRHTGDIGRHIKKIVKEAVEEGRRRDLDDDAIKKALEEAEGKLPEEDGSDGDDGDSSKGGKTSGPARGLVDMLPPNELAIEEDTSQHWSKLLRRVLLKASDIKEVYDPGAASRRLKGQSGADIEVNHIHNIAISLDNSISMGPKKFRKVLQQLGIFFNRFKSYYRGSKIHFCIWSSGDHFRYERFSSPGPHVFDTILRMKDPKGGTEFDKAVVFLSDEAGRDRFDLYIIMTDGVFFDGGVHLSEARSIMQRNEKRTVWISPGRMGRSMRAYDSEAENADRIIEFR